MIVDFNGGIRSMSYMCGLKEIFPFIRMFLDDNMDAVILHFISTNKIPLKDLNKISVALKEVITTIAKRYPGMIPTESAGNTGTALTFHKIRYEHEDLLSSAVFNITRMLIYLQTATVSYAQLSDRGGKVADV